MAPRGSEVFRVMPEGFFQPSPEAQFNKAFRRRLGFSVSKEKPSKRVKAAKRKIVGNVQSEFSTSALEIEPVLFQTTTLARTEDRHTLGPQVFRESIIAHIGKNHEVTNFHRIPKILNTLTWAYALNAVYSVARKQVLGNRESAGQL